MTNRLYKEDDTKQRWIPNMVWVQDGYWQPDPVDPEDGLDTGPVIPTDPIDTNDPVPQYGQLCTSDGSELGVIPDGYVLHVTVIYPDATISDPYPQPVVFSCWGPP